MNIQLFPAKFFLLFSVLHGHLNVPLAGKELINKTNSIFKTVSVYRSETHVVVYESDASDSLGASVKPLSHSSDFFPIRGGNARQ